MLDGTKGEQVGSRYKIERNGVYTTITVRRGVNISGIEKYEGLTKECGWRRITPFPFKIMDDGILIFRYVAECSIRNIRPRDSIE